MALAFAANYPAAVRNAHSILPGLGTVSLKLETSCPDWEQFH
jgi:hypothetical protein